MSSILTDVVSHENPPIGNTPESILLQIPLLQNHQKIISVQECLLAVQHEGGGGVDNRIISMKFKELDLAYLIERSGELQWNLLCLKNYLLGKQKGRDAEKRAFSIVAGTSGNKVGKSGLVGINGFTVIQYKLEVDRSFLQMLLRSFNDGSILVGLRIDEGARQRPNQRSLKASLAEAKIAELLESKQGLRICKSYIYKQHLLVNENLAFCLDVSLKYGEGSPTKMPIQMEVDSFIHNMWFVDESLMDATIVTANGAEVKCLKSILSDKSTVLHSMLNEKQEMMEAQTGRIQMLGNSEEGIQKFIKYLYGFEIGRDTLTPDLAVELFQLANKYDVEKLETSMKHFLCEMGMDWFTPNSILELYFYVRGLESLEEMRTYALDQMCLMTKEVLKESEYFQCLNVDEKGSLLVQLMDWEGINN